MQVERRPVPRWGRVAGVAGAIMLLAIMIILVIGSEEPDRPVIPNPPLATASYVVGRPPETTVLRLEVARTHDEQERGLMGRDDVAVQGMAFPWTGRPANFWMHGTRIPLDIVYVGTDGRIESVTRAEPFDERGVPSRGNVSLVIEVPAGRARLHGLEPGVEVRREKAPPQAVRWSSGG